jgi:hypothetical protein
MLFFRRRATICGLNHKATYFCWLPGNHSTTFKKVVRFIFTSIESCAAKAVIIMKMHMKQYFPFFNLFIFVLFFFQYSYFIFKNMFGLIPYLFFSLYFLSISILWLFKLRRTLTFISFTLCFSFPLGLIAILAYKSLKSHRNSIGNYDNLFTIQILCDPVSSLGFVVSHDRMVSD